MEPILRKYLEKMAQTYGIVDSRGVMQVYRIVELPLDEVFVNLTARLSPRRGEWRRAAIARLQKLASGDRQPVESPSKARPVGEEWFRERIEEEGLAATESGLSMDELWCRADRWVLLGDPGSGKTTLLKHLAVTNAKSLLRGDDGYLPVFITLRFFGQSWARHQWREEEALLAYLEQDGLRELGFEQAQAASLMEIIKKNLGEGRALWLLDGLDEQREVEVKKATVQLVEKLLETFSGNRCMASSRIIGYDAAPLRFDTATLEPFNPEQMSQFFKQWLYAFEKREDIADDAATKHRADEKAEDLLEQVQSNPSVAALATNPLLCTIIGLIHRQGGALPQQRVELYKLCIDTFIFNWEMHKRRRGLSESSLEKDETQAVLEELALYFHEQREENRAPRPDILDVISAFLVESQALSAEEANQKAHALLDLIREVAGLLIDRGNDEYGFFHLSFQEYLSARAITRRRSELDGYLEKYRFATRWREVIRLAAAHQGAKDEESGSAFIEALLRHPHAREAAMLYTFRLAFLCMTEARVELGTSDKMVSEWVRNYLAKPYLQELLPRALQNLRASLRYRAGSLAPLVEACRDPDTAIRASAASAFGALKAPESLPLLQELARDKDDLVRAAVAKTLGQLKLRESLPLLQELARDEKDWVRRNSAKALAQLKLLESLPLLQNLARDKDILVRMAGAEGLGGLKAAEAVPRLRELARDKEASVRAAAAQALGQFRTPDSWLRLRELAKDTEGSVRTAAAEALGRFKDRSLPLLHELARDKDDLVRAAVAKTLGQLKLRESLPLLQELARDKEGLVRMAVAEALRLFKFSESLPLLQELAGDKEGLVRWGAARALRELKVVGALPLLQELAGDKEGLVRSGAARALGELKAAQALAVLETLLQDEYTLVSQAAARAIEQIDLGAEL